MFSLENIHTSNNIQTEQVILRNTYEYPYMHAMAISKRRGHELESEWGGEYGRVLREEREGSNVVRPSKSPK